MNYIPDEYWFLFEHSPGGVSIATDPHCTKIKHNKKASRMLRIQAGEVFSHSSIVPPKVNVFRDGIELEAQEMPMQRTARLKEEVENEVLEFVWEDGHKSISVWNTTPIYDEAGVVIGVLATSEDISHFVLKEREVRLNKEHLERIVSEKIEEHTRLRNEVERLDRLSLVAQMAASISHEVRNPITTVRGFLQLTMKQNNFVNFQKYYELIISELDRANEIIGNFLSLSKKNNYIDREERDLSEIFHAVLPLLEADALMMGKKIMFIEKQVPLLWINTKEIQQVLINLVRNGLEASVVGSSVTVELFEDQNHVGFMVKDEAGGIPAKILEQLGSPFLTTKANGTGLGLSICYDIARRHEAELKVETDHIGSTFIFSFYKT
ncbi:ATP-binding protein [Paenibacillus sp. GCM10023248]|uniref:ATP-binding protein n=1 Tax=Bacillales TaxID=1385 RepID=UPI00237911A6|nr:MULTISPECIES: ATP-binding protein [Bacillales]MDD9269607.1 ATP-binding protein [Paenibacillus sp. MAHUQ-63]MDR6880759.1 signal transduction histidine kinase [Bacillus sp. 3255]